MHFTRIASCILLSFVLVFASTGTANAQPGQLYNCVTSQFLYSSIIIDPDANIAFDVVRTNFNCGSAIAGSTEDNPIVVALNQDGTPLWSKQYGPRVANYTALDESIESNGTFLIVGGNLATTGAKTAIVTKLDALTGNVTWEREIKLKNSMNQYYSSLNTVDIIALNSEYYVLVNAVNTLSSNFSEDMLLFKLNIDGTTNTVWTNHIYETAGQPTYEMVPSALTHFDGSLWVTGTVDYPDSQKQYQQFIRTFFLEIDPTSGARLDGEVFFHHNIIANLEGHANDIWVGSLQSGARDIVIVGNLHEASFGQPRRGAFVNRLNAATTWEGRQLIGPHLSNQWLTDAHSVDYGVDLDRAWIIAGDTRWGPTSTQRFESAYLMEFDQAYGATSCSYGRTGNGASDRTSFNAVASWGHYGNFPAPTLESGYTAVGIAAYHKPGVGLETEFYVAKIDEALVPATAPSPGCHSTPGPTFDLLETRTEDFFVDRSLTIENTEGYTNSEDYIDPDFFCHEEIAMNKSSADEISIDTPLSNTLTVGSHVSAENGALYFFESEQAQEVTISIVDVSGKTLATRTLKLTAGTNDVYLSVQFDTSGVFYSRIESQDGVHTIPHSIVR